MEITSKINGLGQEVKTTVNERGNVTFVAVHDIENGLPINCLGNTYEYNDPSLLSYSSLTTIEYDDKKREVKKVTSMKNYIKNETDFTITQSIEVIYIDAPKDNIVRKTTTGSYNRGKLQYLYTTCNDAKGKNVCQINYDTKTREIERKTINTYTEFGEEKYTKVYNAKGDLTMKTETFYNADGKSYKQVSEDGEGNLINSEEW